MPCTKCGSRRAAAQSINSEARFSGPYSNSGAGVVGGTAGGGAGSGVSRGAELEDLEVSK